VSVGIPLATVSLHQSAIKLHTLLDLRGSIPSFIHISDGKLHDVNVLDLLLPNPAPSYVMDPRLPGLRATLPLHEAGSFFRHARQVEPQSRSSLLASRGIARAGDMRSIRGLDGFYPQGVPTAASHQVPRSKAAKRLIS